MKKTITKVSGYPCPVDGTWRSLCECGKEVRLRLGDAMPECPMHGRVTWLALGEKGIASVAAGVIASWMLIAFAAGCGQSPAPGALAVEADAYVPMEVATECDIEIEAIPFESSTAPGLPLPGDVYAKIAEHDLDRTDVHTGSVVVPTEDGTHYYYLIPDGDQWTIDDTWPFDRDRGGCLFDINSDVWDLVSLGGIYEFDPSTGGWTDGNDLYQLRCDDRNTLFLSAVE